MRVERVSIEGFGALEGETLELAPGMTVVFGPNESAKTTLHSALYAALCGMRRGRGQPRAEDKLFAERHRPWDGGAWRVQALLQLADGRRIELWHDLNGRVDCRAVDLDLGRDVSAEIMFEGAPNGSKWLGFDRCSFVATACVRQSAIAAVLENANALQDELQRAAASAGRDETAAGAIEGLKSFSSENVGLDRANSTRPLHRAIVELERSTHHLDEARRCHDDYLGALVGVHERGAAHDAVRRELRLAEAVVTRAAAAKAEVDAARAEELAQKYPQEPEGVAGQNQLGDEIAEALALWEGCPPEPDLTGETIEALEEQLAGLPQRPDGDRTPVQEVLDGEAALKAAEQVLAEHELGRPPTGATVLLPAEPSVLENLAVVLEVDVPEVDPELHDRVRVLQTRVGRAGSAGRRGPLTVAAAVAVAGIAAIVAVSPLVGLALFAVAAVIAGMAVWLARGRPDGAAVDALDTAERMLRKQQESAEVASKRRSEALETLRSIGAPVEAEAVRALLSEANVAAVTGEASAVWEAQHARLCGTHQAAEVALRDALRARSVPG